LAGPLKGVIGLSDKEICDLTDYFRIQDGRILYSQFCELIHDSGMTVYFYVKCSFRTFSIIIVSLAYAAKSYLTIEAKHCESSVLKSVSKVNHER